MFYAQSTITVVAGRYSFRHIIIVKNMYMLNLVFNQIFKNSLKKWVKHKTENLFSYIRKSFVKTIQKTGSHGAQHIKVSKERLFIMTQTRSLQMFGVIPFVKLQNDT